MSFNVGAHAYLAFMGRYSVPLAVQFADFAEAAPGQLALDVGCGSGALTSELVRRLGSEAVSAVEPSLTLASAAYALLPDVTVCRATAERLPFRDDVFDLASAQLVVHFMTNPVAGLREMGRVTRQGGTVAACVWDHAGDRGPVTVFWRAARQVDPAAPDESDLAGVREGHLAALFAQAGLGEARVATLTVTARYPSFELWWEPFTLGVGPAGDYLASLDEDHQSEVRERCRRLLPSGRVEIRASAWAAACRL